MSTLTIAEALQTVLGGIEGLVYCQIGEPATVHAGQPVGSITLDGQGVSVTGQISARLPRYLFRVWFVAQEYPQAERDLMTLADRVITAIEADPHLDGAIVSGIARIVDQRAGWATVAQLTYRVLDTVIEVVNKVAYGS